MNDKKKALKLRLNTPEGTAKFPWLTEPDTRFNPDGEYSVNLIIPEDDPKTQALVAKIEKIWEDFKKTLKGPKLKQTPTLGFDKEYTDDGDETGNLIFKFKAKTGYTDDKGNRKELQPPKLFDAKLKPMDNSVPVWGGSTMIVNFTPQAYDHGKNLGITLRLNACQIIQLVTAGGGASADAYGFSEQEGFSGAEDLDETYEGENEEVEVEEDEDGGDF